MNSNWKFYFAVFVLLCAFFPKLFVDYYTTNITLKQIQMETEILSSLERINQSDIVKNDETLLLSYNKIKSDLNSFVLTDNSFSSVLSSISNPYLSSVSTDSIIKLLSSSLLWITLAILIWRKKTLPYRQMRIGFVFSCGVLLWVVVLLLTRLISDFYWLSVVIAPFFLSIPLTFFAYRKWFI